MCVVMEGYDVSLIGNFFAYPTFARKYGTYYPLLNEGAGGYQLTAAWQAGVGNASGVGAFFGVLMNGWLVDLFGQKRTLLFSLVALTCFIFIVFFSPNLIVLTIGELLCGLPWGVFASTAPAYASEVLPLSIRVYLTSYTNMSVHFPLYCQLLTNKVLHYRSAHRRWSSQRSGHLGYSMVIQNPLCTTMDMASLPHSRSLLCTRISMAFSAQGPLGGS